jgi:PQQ-dependent dehydrogenase (methanol/ethanol family)
MYEGAMIMTNRHALVALVLFAAGAAPFGQVKPSPPAAAVRSVTAVTDEMLRNPSSADWLHPRRSYNGWGYSPLDQINRQNVGQMRLAWSWSMQEGNQQTTPLVHDGVMYLANPGSTVQALDAATGDLLWEYRREFAADIRAPNELRPLRGLSIYDDKIFVNTGDAHLVALDARTGSVVWDVPVAGPNERFSYSAPALIVRGKVISGLQSCEYFYQEKCAITAHDAKTGKELWRTSTIAHPGQPGGDTWGDVPLMFRAGADMWITGSYDPELNLVYWSTAQAKPWSRAARGTDGDALYSNTVLALDPDTGRIVWFNQLLPGETHDMDEVFENILVDAGPRKSLFKMGKLGILWQIDRQSGKFVSARDLGYQNLVRVDQSTGKVTYRPGMIPELGQVIDFCPSLAGFKSWRAMAFHPETRAFYIPLLLTCQKGSFTDVKKVEGGGGLGQGRRDNYIHPESGGNGNLGEFAAMDSTTGRILWLHRQRAPFNSAALTTAGGLAFVGDWNRYINAYDVSSGKLLWQTRLTMSPQGFPVTYAAGGRQYVAVPVGGGAASWGTTIPLLLVPEIKRPGSGNALFVFALP